MKDVIASMANNGKKVGLNLKYTKRLDVEVDYLDET